MLSHAKVKKTCELSNYILWFRKNNVILMPLYQRGAALESGGAEIIPVEPVQVMLT